MSSSLLKSKNSKNESNIKNLTISLPIQDYNAIPKAYSSIKYSKSLGNLGIFDDGSKTSSTSSLPSAKSPIMSTFKSPTKSTFKSPTRTSFMSPTKSKSSKKANKKSPLMISAPFSPSAATFYSPNTSPKSASLDRFDNLDNYDTIEHSRKGLGSIILVTEYEFQAESIEELSFKKREYLRLIDRPGDGWLRVKKVSNNGTGLIPASYVKIHVNDLLNPVTHDWLNEIVPLEANVEALSLFDFEKQAKRYQKEHGYDTTSIQSTSNSNSARSSVSQRASHAKVGLKSINIANVLTKNDKFWYRIDLKLTNNDEIYMMKDYHEFYTLNYQLSLLNFENLPNFPQPMKFSNTKDKKTLENILIRCAELNVYINKVVKFEYYKNSAEIAQFFDKGEKVINPRVNSDDVINDRLLQDGISLIDLLHPTQDYDRKNNGRTVPLQVTESESMTSFTSLLDTYDQSSISPAKAKNRKYRSSSSADSGDMYGNNSDYTYTSSSKHDDDSVFSKSPITPQNIQGEFINDILTPSTPITVNNPTSPTKTLFLANTFIKTPSGNPNISKFITHEFVKIKVLLNNVENDIIVIKVRTSNISSMIDVKRLVSYKIYKDIGLINHYRLTMKDKSLTEEEMVEQIKTSNKVTLTLVRVRGSV